MGYNLLEEAWIPVLYLDGRWGHVGIRGALERASRIRLIAASNPMDRLAIFRFLLALLYWCRGNPPTDKQVAPKELSFPAEWFAKLDANKGCFDLLSAGKRFYQYRKSESTDGGRKLSASYLIHEIPTGTNFWHFRHASDSVDGLCSACCAMGLLRLPLFATSGGCGKPPGINAKPPVYAVPWGRSLAATLRLSWREVSLLGTPAWEKPDLKLPDQGEIPLLTGLTWLPRQVWLDNPEQSGATCIACGRKERLIRRCVFAGIGSMKTSDNEPGRVWRDPHAVYVTEADGKLASLHARDASEAHDAAGGQWSEIMAGAVRTQKEHAETDGLWIVGFATVKNDKYIEAVEWTIPFSHVSPEAAQKIEQWQKEGRKLIQSLARTSRRPGDKGPARKHVEIPPMVFALRPNVENRVSARAGDLLSASDDAWEEAAHEYRPMMEAVAKSLSPGFTTAALAQRRRVAMVMPSMKPKAESPTKSRRKPRGGDQ